MTNLLLIRHAQSVGLLTQWVSDPPLSQSGQSEAHRLADYLHELGTISQVYSSPLKRARQTAEILVRKLRLPKSVRPELSEASPKLIGELGLYILASRVPVAVRRLAPMALRRSLQWPNSNRSQVFVTRVGRALEEIVCTHQGQTVVVVSHAVTIRAALAHYLDGDAQRWWSTSIRWCTVTQLTIGNGAATPVMIDGYPLG